MLSEAASKQTSLCWGVLGEGTLQFESMLGGCVGSSAGLHATSIDQFLFSLCVVLKNSCLVCLAFVSPLTGVVLYVCAS